VRKFFLYWFPVIVWAGLIFAVSSIPNLKSELPGGWDLFLRKCAHAVEYMIFAFLILRAFSSSGRVSWIDIFFVIVLVALYAASDEIHQTVVIGRHGSLWDTGFDTLAGIVGAIFSRRILLKCTDRKRKV